MKGGDNMKIKINKDKYSAMILEAEFNGNYFTEKFYGCSEEVAKKIFEKNIRAADRKKFSYFNYFLNR